MAMQHPDVKGRDLILECVLGDEGTRMIEGKGELRVRDGGLTAREESNFRWESVSARGAASRAAAGTLRESVSGVDEGGGEKRSRYSSTGSGGNCGVM